MNKQLQTSAMLAALSVSQWTARKHDKSVSIEVETQHGARDAGRYNKMLIDKAALEPMEKMANAARQYHYKLTLPWGDNGERLLPSSLFFDYTTSMRVFKSEFEDNVRAFVAAYPTLVEAAKQRLGTMYDPNDYPLPWQVKDRFEFSTAFSPVPTANDFRVNLNQEYVDSIKADITERLQQRQKDAVKDCWMRVRKVVGNMTERLGDKDKKFHDSLIQNARDLIDILPALNLTNDQELNDIATELQSILVPPDRLRADVALRTQTAKKANDILAKLPWA